MASAKTTPKVSRISRGRTVAYARKQKSGAADSSEPSEPAEAALEGDAPAAASVDDGAASSSVDEAAASADQGAASGAASVDQHAASVDQGAPAPAPTPAVSEPTSPTSTPTSVTAPMQAASPPEEPSARPRTRSATVSMPVQSSIGAPPEMPASSIIAAAPVDPAVAESPTRMPGPREIPGGSPDDPASPPGTTPPGDSRSMRRRTERYEFALIYRIQTYVISRFGVVGVRGQWRVVEYPTSAAASHAYAKEVSRFVSEGFSDYRD